ncbi:SDR family oxidoreductase [Vibrio quintilis]|uniref:SDR family oxidoreductase n=1 Tax=Vibrio quintilis TaxID=1117707 RepID=UPI00093667BA|nr:SDR family oxidoreductase [Vibrio quintilis]
MKRILITCATSHIGSAVAAQLSATHELILTGRDTEKLSKIKCETEREHPVVTQALDFFDPNSVDLCCETMQKQDKQLDGIVFILPRIPPSGNVFPDDEDWSELYRKYFITPLRLLRQLTENNMLRQGCKIVMISGLSSKSALTSYATNNCIRHAWLGQAKTMALSLASQKISVNTLSLGGVMTGAYIQKMQLKAADQGISYDELMQNEVSNIPLQKYAAVEDVAEAIIALLGPLANHMTGQNMLLDGGFFKGY